MNLLPLWNDSVVLALLLTTGVLTFACLAAPLLRRSATLKNSVLLPTLIITCVIPIALAAARGTGWSIPLEVLEVAPVVDAPDEHSTAATMDAPRGPDAGLPGTLADPGAMALSAATTTQAATTTPATPATPEVATRAPDGASTPTEARSNALTARPVVLALLALWASGSLIGLVRLVRSYRALRRLLATTRPIDDPRVAAAAAEARSALGLRSYPAIAATRRVGSPVAFGTPRRGWVLCPPDALDTLPHDQMVHVLTHEGAHIAHRDSTLRLVQAVSAALWWWHPLVHVMNRQLSRTREELCDNRVLSSTDPVQYSETLLEFGRRPTAHRTPALAAGLFPEHERLEQRIRNLLNPRRSTMSQCKPSIIIAVCLAGAAASALAGVTRMTTHPAPADATWAVHDDRTVAQEYALSFPDASEPGHLDVDIKRGDIRVTAYDGELVLVRLSVPKSAAKTDVMSPDGFRTVTSRPIDFEVRQKGNFIELDGNDYEQITHVEVFVPRTIDLTLDSYRTGVITVAGVTGHIRARSQNNDIVLTNVSGSADVYGYNGSFTATFRDVTGELEFETYNGNIDLSLPATTRTTTLIDSERFDVRSQFAIAERPTTLEVAEDADGRRSIDFGKYAVGDINGGGARTILETTNGRIVLRAQ